MSALTDEIRAACTEIADNQKEIYQLGYEKGRASVKHIKFTVVSSAEILDFCAFLGMTWRELVASDMANDYFVIKNEKVFYTPYTRDSYWLGCGADDEIVADGVYYALKNLFYGKDEFYVDDDCRYFSDAIEKYNKEKYYVDKNGYVRAKDDRMVIACEGIGACWGVKATEDIDNLGGVSYGLSPDADVIMFNLDYSNAVAKRGGTWAEYCDSIYSNGTWFVDGDSVMGWSSELIQLNGVNVKPTDVIIEGANYEFAYQ